MKKIIAATTVAIFSLATCIVGTYAWFLNNTRVQVETGYFEVVSNGDCEIHSINLIKFDYHSNVYGSGANQFVSIDYLNPEKGAVNKYQFNEANNKFGYIEKLYYQWSGSDWISSDEVPLVSVNKGSCADYESLPNDPSIGDYYSIASTVYYKWDGDKWATSSDEPATGTDRGSCADVQHLPHDPATGDYYDILITSYFQWTGEAWVEKVEQPLVSHDCGSLDSYEDITDPLVPGDYYQFDIDAKYYKWNDTNKTWISSFEEPSGNDEGELDFVDDLPKDSSDGDYYKVLNTTWKTVDVMNTYDPVDRIIFGSDLKDLNCNAIYEVTLESTSFTDAYLKALALKKTGIVPTSNELLFTTCLDFDIFFADDLLATNAAFKNKYYQWTGTKWLIRGELDALEDGTEISSNIALDNLPEPIVANVGDFYLNNNDSHFYRWTGLMWNDEGTVLPSISTDCGSVADYASLPAGRSEGDYFYVTADERYYRWNGTDWIARAEEPQKGVYKGTIADQEAFDALEDLSEGDIYRRDDNNLYYRWDGEVWNESVERPPLGFDGGTVATTSNLPLGRENGDFYKNEDNNKYYQWNGSSWVEFNDKPEVNTDKGSVNGLSTLLNKNDYFTIRDADVTEKQYYPSYIDKEEPLSKDEEIYYKLSYLSHVMDEEEHSHFYGGADLEKTLTKNGGEEVTFSGTPKKLITFYINVNYAPSCLDEEYNTKIYEKDFKAIYDFSFKFMVGSGAMN